MGLGIMLQVTYRLGGCFGQHCMLALSLCCSQHLLQAEIDYWSKMKYFPDLMAYYFLQ